MNAFSDKTEENETKGDLVRVRCSGCNQETRHIVLQSIDQAASERLYPDDPDSAVQWTNHYQIIQCQGCEAISFRHLNWFSEAQDIHSDGTNERLYPHRISRQAREFLNAPPTIRRIYREIIDCFNLECVTLCGAGLRAIVEGICADNGIKKGPVEVRLKDGSTVVQQKSTLEGKIAGMAQEGIITEKQARVLHEHRYLGNDALHQLQQPSVLELGLAIEIIEHTLEALYEMAGKAEGLRLERAKRRPKK